MQTAVQQNRNVKWSDIPWNQTDRGENVYDEKGFVKKPSLQHGNRE